MAKPEEVIVVEDENGNIVRETLKDSDVLAQYKQMRETLVYLSHLDHSDTQNQVRQCTHARADVGELCFNSALAAPQEFGTDFVRP